MRRQRNPHGAGGKRRPWLAGALGVAACFGGSQAPASAQNAIETVLLDRAQVMPYPPSTETIVVGNPIIADVTMLRNTGQVILTGKGFGDTNLLFIDGRGVVLADTRLRVREAPSTMVVQRGASRETYACHPRCEPTVALGDDSEFLKQAAKDVQLRNALATGASMSGPPTR